MQLDWLILLEFYPAKSAQIERLSWLECQGAQLRPTMVILGENLSEDYSIFDQKFANSDQSVEAKNPRF